MSPNLLIDVVDGNGKGVQKTCRTICHWSCDRLIDDSQCTSRCNRKYPSCISSINPTWTFKANKNLTTEPSKMETIRCGQKCGSPSLTLTKEKLTMVTETTCNWQKKQWIMNIVWAAYMGHYPVGGPMACDWDHAFWQRSAVKAI